MHARKAWLKGLSPKENREIPPLDYARVYRLKARAPDLEIIINGGIAIEAACSTHHVDGVMLGRAAYQEPWRLLAADALVRRGRALSQIRSRRSKRFFPMLSANWRKARACMG